jgi:hypothetical protein
MKTGTTITGIVFKDGVVLGADTRSTNGRAWQISCKWHPATLWNLTFFAYTPIAHHVHHAILL